MSADEINTTPYGSLRGRPWPEEIDQTHFESEGKSAPKKEPLPPSGFTTDLMFYTIEIAVSFVFGCIAISAVAGTVRLVQWLFGN